DLAVLEEGRGDEQAMIGRLLDERHDRGEVPGGRREARQARIVEAHRDLRGQVLELVSGQAELREDDEVRAAPARLLDQLVVTGEVRLELAELRGDLGEGDREALHGPSIAPDAASTPAARGRFRERIGPLTGTPFRAVSRWEQFASASYC